MKNILEIMKSLGIEVPSDKESDLNKAVAENYKTIVEYEKKIGKLEAERDHEKERADKSEETLKGFEGIDPAKMSEEIEKYKAQAEQAKADYEKQIADRDYADLVDKAVASLKFTSNSAKKAFIAELNSDKLKVKNNTLIGFDDFVKAYKESDADAFSIEDVKPTAKFTQAMPTQTKDTTVTKESIMSITDRAERRKAMADHMDLFQTNKEN